MLFCSLRLPLCDWNSRRKTITWWKQRSVRSLQAIVELLHPGFMKMTKKRLYVWDLHKFTICHSLKVRKSLDNISTWIQRLCLYCWWWSCCLVSHRVSLHFHTWTHKNNWIILFMQVTSGTFPAIVVATDGFDQILGRLQLCSCDQITLKYNPNPNPN